MKTHLFRGWKWFATVGGAAAVLGGFVHLNNSHAQGTPPLATESAPRFEGAGAQKSDLVVPENVSPRIAEIARLAQSNVSQEVLLAFIKKSTQSFNPSAEEILYLSDLGVSDDVITTLMQHQPTPQVNYNPAPAPVVTSNVITPTAPPPAAAEAPVSYAPPVTVREPSAVVSTTYFVDTLRPYGSWVEVDGYGRCWQPTVVVSNPGWRPYCDRGHWVYTDCGWYWQSDYSWGWAAFHYGRWHQNSNFGWVWAPDCTWGPSWVSWRYNEGYCGWAPLPPAARFDVGVGFYFGGSHAGLSVDFGLSSHDYFFLPTSHFVDRNPYRHGVSQTQSRNIYNNSTVVNNYIVGNNNTVINEGIGRERVASATRSEIRPLAIRPVATTANANSTREVVDRQRQALNVYRPVTTVKTPAGPRVEVASAAPTPRNIPQLTSGNALQGRPGAPALDRSQSRPAQREMERAPSRMVDVNGHRPAAISEPARTPPVSRDRMEPSATRPAAPAERMPTADHRNTRNVENPRSTETPRIDRQPAPATPPAPADRHGRPQDRNQPSSLRYPGSDIGSQVIGSTAPAGRRTEVAQIDSHRADPVRSQRPGVAPQVSENNSSYRPNPREAASRLDAPPVRQSNPQPAYREPAYQAPPAQRSAPQPSYQQPAYQAPQARSAPPQPSYQQPSYQAPQARSAPPQPSYQQPYQAPQARSAPPQPSYQQPSYQAPQARSAPPQPSYQQPSYQAPQVRSAPPQPSYQQPSYQAPQMRSAPPQPAYQPPPTAPRDAAQYNRSDANGRGKNRFDQ